MGNVTVGGIVFAINGTLQGAKDYLVAGIGAGPDAFNALPNDAAGDNLRGKFLVAATRYLYANRWQGTPTVPGQLTAFPRDGVVDQNGAPVLNGTTPINIQYGEYEMAAILTANAAAASAASTGSNVKRLEAGPVNIEYFRPTDTLDTSTPMPKVVWDLVAAYLAAALNDGAAVAYGSDPCTESVARSQFEDCDEYTRVVR